MTLSEKISRDLKLDLGYIEKIIDNANRYYKVFTIPKKKGGKRTIMQASPELKSLQYWVRENILCKMSVSEASYAYGKGDSVKRHSLYHVNSNYILHADIRDFFPSIQSRLLEKELKKRPDIFDDLDISVDDSIASISKICFKKDSLCIGTVSSPIISNIVMYDFDREMIDRCERMNYRYSRYADDMYISSQNFIPAEEVKNLHMLLVKYGFKLNGDKTYFASKKDRRSVTGIIITDDSRISIGTKRKSGIKKMVYDKLIHGEGNSNKILGHLAFLKDIEPNYYNKIITKYSTYCDGDIISSLKKDI